VHGKHLLNSILGVAVVQVLASRQATPAAPRP
jgi:hypothetical protein